MRHIVASFLFSHKPSKPLQPLLFFLIFLLVLFLSPTNHLQLELLFLLTSAKPPPTPLNPAEIPPRQSHHAT